jgi:hypothetical protein
MKKNQKKIKSSLFSETLSKDKLETLRGGTKDNDEFGCDSDMCNSTFCNDNC